MTLWDYLSIQRNVSTSPSSPSGAHTRDPGKSATTRFTDRTRAEEQTSRSGLRTVLIFSAILVPCAVIPYILIRRQYHTILREIITVRVANESFAREMRRFTTTDAPKAQKRVEDILAVVREHRTKLETNAVALADVKESLDAARARLDDLQGKLNGLEQNIVTKVQGLDRTLSTAQKAGVEQHKTSTEWREEVNRSLAAFAAESMRWRSSITQDVRETGISLANLAGFVEEVERREGWTPLPNDGRGIDRMRNLAKRLGEHGQSKPTKSKPTKPESKKSEPTKRESTKPGPAKSEPAKSLKQEGHRANGDAEPSPSK